MNRRLIQVALASAALALISACDRGPLATGPVRTEARDVETFDSIELNGTVHLYVTVGVPASLELEGRDPFLGRLRTEVHGDTLEIKANGRDWMSVGTSPRLIVRVGVPELEDLQVQGGNKIVLKGFAGGETKIKLEGATRLVAEGKLDELQVEMAGAGHADLGDLITTEADVTVSGVGSVFVHPTDRLDATMRGVGAIMYQGSPRKVNTRMHGMGAIGQRSAEEFRREQGDPEAIDPETLQPEYDPRDEPVEKDTASTEVI